MSALTARPTIYRGTQMRSRLEARFAAHLDRLGFQWDYEPVCYAGTGGEYLPDFLIHPGPRFTGPAAFVEIKHRRADHAQALRRMHVIRESEPKAPLFVFTQDEDETWRIADECQGAAAAGCEPCRLAHYAALARQTRFGPDGRAILGSAVTR